MTIKNKIAAQMFTLREHTQTATDFEDSLRRVSDIGYCAIQLSAVGAMNGIKPEVNAAKARKLLDRYGLKCIATHRPWSNLIEHTEQEIEFHLTLGCDFTAIGVLPQAMQAEGINGVRRFIDESRGVIDALKKHNIKFGYHNHDRELIRLGANGLRAMDILIDEADNDLFLELDLYWLTHGGINPERVVERCAGRMPVIHVKDMEVVQDKVVAMAPVGEGNLDWPNLIPACERAGTEWYAVEQDICRRDPFNCLASSYRFLSNLRC